jgi:plastocyanin
MNFVQTAVTLQKGESITLVADDSMPHIIANGTWQNGTAQATKEAGAPEVNNVQIQGRNSSQTIGPFKASGTFHFYCTIHPGMNLTVTVQ